MKPLADGNLQKIKCSQKSMHSKNKNNNNAKDSETTDEINMLNEAELSAALKNTLHISSINSNITNGTSDHPSDDSPTVISDHPKSEGKIDLEACGESHKEAKFDVNSINSAPTNNGGIQEISFSDMNKVRFIFDEALENLRSTIDPEGQTSHSEIEIVSYESELQMPEIMRLIQKDLSEPYSIYTYRYFIHNWPKLCFLATHDGKCIGAIVCKLDLHRNIVRRGYIAMLAVDEKYRKKKIGSRLVRKAIQAMINDNADEVVLETEITNKPALKLYENLGFVRDKRLFRYYLNGVDALRLKLWLR